MNTQPMIMVAPDRVLHVCRLGSRLDYRVIGAHVIYVGLEEEITVYQPDGSSTRSRVISVKPYQRHRIAAGRQYVKTILVEPETATERCLDDLHDTIGDTTLVEPLLAGLLDPNPLRRAFSCESTAPITKHEFDRLNFGYELESREMDERIEVATKMLRDSIGDAILTDDCAEEFSISSSRFRRLFVGDTGVQFRKYRMWRRARAYLEQVLSMSSLTEIALDLGYPDSTHFSRSIRSTYGLPPREMKTRMQGSDFLISNERSRSVRLYDHGR